MKPAKNAISPLPWKRNRTTKPISHNLAAVRIKLPDPQKQAQARLTLERLSKSAPFRAGSLRALLNDAIQRSNLEAADSFAQELQLSPQVTFSDGLLCLDFYKKLDQKKLATLLEKVKPLAAREPDDLAALMGWMNANRMSADVLRWMEKLPSEKTSGPPAAIEVADAFSAQKNWARLRRWTKGGDWGESEYLRLAYQAYARQQSRPEGTEAESLWHEAERACEENPEREIRLARLASKWNLPAQAEQLWLRVAHDPLSRREALDSLFTIYRANNDLPNLYLTVMRLHETSPDEPLIAAEYARLSLLLDRNREEGRRVAKEAFDQAPTEPPCAVAQALFLNSKAVPPMESPSCKSCHPKSCTILASLFISPCFFSTMKRPRQLVNSLIKRTPVLFSRKRKNFWKKQYRNIRWSPRLLRRRSRHLTRRR